MKKTLIGAEGSGYADRRPIHAHQEGWGLAPACVDLNPVTI